MSSSRSGGFDGPDPLSLTDIANWSHLTGNIIRRDEVMIVRAMDMAYLVAVNKEQADRRANGSMAGKGRRNATLP